MVKHATRRMLRPYTQAQAAATRSSESLAPTGRPSGLSDQTSILNAQSTPQPGVLRVSFRYDCGNSGLLLVESGSSRLARLALLRPYTEVRLPSMATQRVFKESLG